MRMRTYAASDHVPNQLNGWVHLVISTLGVIMATGLLTYFVVAVLQLFGLAVPISLASHLLTEMPLFPLQALVGLVIGSCTGMRISRHGIYAVLSVSVLCFGSGFFIHRSGVGYLSYFLGYGCTVTRGCFDQFLITLPAVTSLSYLCGVYLRRIRSTGSRAAEEH